MKKIPTYFERDWDGDRSRVLNQVHDGCEWVANGEGWATQKLDGTCCAVIDGKFFKRHEVKKGKPAPDGFVGVDADEQTGKRVGWVPVGDGPEDQWHREAVTNRASPLCDGTYELLGPKVQGNPEGVGEHWLVLHRADTLHRHDVPRSFEGVREWLSRHDVEGIVWHHPDGRMAKIKKRDFGLPRKPAAE